MAYNYPFYGQQPYPYQDQLNQLRTTPMYPQPMQARQDQTGLNWVQGEAGAKSWFVAPGATVLLMDSETMRFYLKSADANGVPSMRTFAYSEVSQQLPRQPEAVPEPKYVTVEEFAEFRTEMLKKLESPAEAAPSRKKKGDTTDE